MHDLVDRVRTQIRDIPDFPKPGILFKDITPLLADPDVFAGVIMWFADFHRGKGIQHVVGMESRGFIFGAALAMHLGAGFVPARKKGKLPYDAVAVEYALEYGTATLEIHSDAIRRGEKVLIVDDLLATGGTARAAVDLVRKLGGEVVASEFVIELGFLRGRDKLDCPVRSLIVY